MPAGIYIIISATHPGRQYIGSCFDFRLRTMVHQSHLIHNSHPNQILQAHSNKYSVNDLVFALLEECSREQLLIREQYYLDFLHPYFNICQVAGSRAGTRHSFKTKLKIQAANKVKRLPSRSESIRGRFVKKRL